MRSAVFLCLVATAFAGCGSGDDSAGGSGQESTPTATAETASAGDVEVAIQDFKYVPAETAVEAGSTVNWTNEDGAPHTATADNGSFDTGDLREGDSGKVTLREPGEYEYFCEFHKFMRGRITVN